ncbi:MAG: RdgB/HAM1 family non-canonical purine NTP pyrophosphatase [Chloroflexota bacterium]
MKLLIASSNPGKLREAKAILANTALELLLPADLNLNLVVDETGSTYTENAVLKALAYRRASNLTSLADDSGLEVDALGGEPGLHSATYAPLENARDADRRAYLLRRLAGIPHPADEPGWRARFHCTVVIAATHGALYYAEGRCDGFIIPEERGSGGFGYDALFFMPEHGQTMAELSEEVKNLVSHRARALQSALPILRRLAEDQAG